MLRPTQRAKDALPVKAAPVAIVATMSIAEAYAAIVEGALAHLEANEGGVLSGVHPEFLHQLRVALRRLRSAFSVFPDTDRSGHLAAEMRWLAAQIGGARDWDVFVFETLPLARKALPGSDAISEIRRRTMPLRRAAWRKARRAMATERYQALKHGLRQSACTVPDAAPGRSVKIETQSDLPHYAALVLRRRYAKVRRRGRSLSRQGWDELHTLRIAVKKLRYPVEFFFPLFDTDRARQLRSRLTALQDVLGLINDSATTQQLLDSAIRADTPELARAVGTVAGWAEGRSSALRRELNSAWKAFRDTKVFW